MLTYQLTFYVASAVEFFFLSYVLYTFIYIYIHYTYIHFLFKIQCAIYSTSIIECIFKP